LIAVDTNILVHAHRRDAELHRRAERAMRSLAEGPAQWAIPWPCLHEFLAIVTHPRIFDPPTPQAGALGQVDAWLASPQLVLLGEAGDHWARLRDLLRDGAVVGPMVHDARIAAICRSHGVAELWSIDRDFGRFPALRTVNPLTGKDAAS
jgi:toxin-antitoxin system PIN domain toxin